MRRRGLVVLVVMLVSVGGAIGAQAGSEGSSAQTPRIVRVVAGLQSPVYATQAPGEPRRLYVVEQRGVIKVVERGRIRRAPFLDIRSLVGSSGNEQGLLGLAFAPDYAKSRLLVVNYTDRSGNTRVVAYRSNGQRALPASARVVLGVPQPYSNHNGGMVEFGPDGKLYVGLGDGGSGGDPENRAQDMSDLLGKLVRLDPRLARPTPQIVALGLRNPWRFSFDRANGDLWIGDVGQGDIEEIDVLRKAASAPLVNFGWDVWEGTRSFENKPLGPGRLVQPVFQYTHDDGCSVTGGFVYRGKLVPAARGRYYYGDYCSGIVWSGRAAAPRASGPRVESFRVPELTSFGQSLAGELYLVSRRGAVYRLAR